MPPTYPASHRWVVLITLAISFQVFPNDVIYSIRAPTVAGVPAKHPNSLVIPPDFLPAASADAAAADLMIFTVSEWSDERQRSVERIN